MQSGQPGNVIDRRVAKRERGERLAARLESLHVLRPGWPQPAAAPAIDGNGNRLEHSNGPGREKGGNRLGCEEGAAKLACVEFGLLEEERSEAFDEHVPR